MMADATMGKERDQAVDGFINPTLVVGGEQDHPTTVLFPVPLTKAREKAKANSTLHATKANLPTATPPATAHRLTHPTKPKTPAHFVAAITLPAIVGNDRMRRRKMG